MPPALKADAAIYLEGTSQGGGGGEPASWRPLHPGRLLELLPQGYRIGLREMPGDLEVGSDLVLFYELGRRFVRQLVTTRTLAPCDGYRALVELEISGDPLCAESRFDTRLPAESADLLADLGPARKCAVIDVSATGLAVCARLPLEISEAIPAALIHEGVRIPGTLEVRNRLPLEGGAYRYGLCCVPMPDGTNLLQRALPRIHMAIHRALFGDPSRAAG